MTILAPDERVNALLAGDTPEKEPPPAPLNLPDAFWNARPELQTIRQIAHSRARSADAVLGVFFARVCAATPPTLGLPPIVGSRGSLNVVVTLIGPSGAGKSTCKDIACEHVALDPTNTVDDFPVGSGEGLIDSYFEMVEEEVDGKKTKVKRQTKRSLFAYVDEGQALTEIGKRNGTTIMQVIRSGWSGGVLGQGNAGVETKRILPAGSYRMALVAAFQTVHAAALLDDAGGGTPQRFLWLHAIDPNIPTTRLATPPPLTWKPPVATSFGGVPFDTTMDVDEAVKEEIYQQSVAVSRGDTELAELDSHRNLVRLKAAGLLAILNQRWNIAEEDWALAGILMTTSDAVRDHVAATARLNSRMREERATATQINRALATGEATEGLALMRAAGVVGRYVHKWTGSDHDMDRSGLSRALSPKQRVDVGVDAAIEAAIARTWIIPQDDIYIPGPGRPA